MKLLQSKQLWVLTSFILFAGYWVSCTKDNQVLDVPTTETNSATDLVSKKVTTAPTIDGTIDAAWDNATKLEVTNTVPDPGNGLFNGYIGAQYPATIRSVYDDQNIYFLVEIPDATQSVNVAPWYFNPALNNGKDTTGWIKEPSSNAYDGNGALTRAGWGEDKFAMLWNIDNSTPKFISATCYASCHVFTPYMNYAKDPAVYTSNANSGNHYTNGSAEKIDMWWGRLGYMSKDASLNFVDDNYQDFAGGPDVTNLTGGSANGRHVDGITVDTAKTYLWPYAPHYSASPAQGEVNNTQSLKLDGTGAKVNVPLWVIPGGGSPDFSYPNFILSTETTNGTAKKVTGVSSTGILTLSDGSTIDPTVGTDYQRTAGANGATAKKSIAPYIVSPLQGGRKDITGSAIYTGTGWVIEYKRKLKTDDTLKQDVDFSNLEDEPFGFAVWDRSNYQHGIQPNLVLKFQK